MTWSRDGAATVMGAFPTPHANRAAFLMLERERRSLAADLVGADHHRRGRYRDLVLITSIIRLQYEHLVGRVGDSSEAHSLPDELHTFKRDRPAEWARPWGAGPMFELRTMFPRYRQRRNRLAERLSPAARLSAEAAADRRLEGLSISISISVTSRIERIMREWTQEVKRGPVPASKLESQPPLKPMAEPPGEAAAKEAARSWAGVLASRAAAIAATVLVIAGIDAAIQRGLGSDSPSTPSEISASGFERSLPALGRRSPGPRPAQGREASDRSPTPKQTTVETGETHSTSQTRQTAPTQTAPAPEPEPAPEPAPVPVSAPEPEAPAPATAAASAPTAQQEFGFEN